MAGYLGAKAVLLSTTAATVTGDMTVGGAATISGAFTSLGIDDNAASTAVTIDASGNVGIGTASPDKELHVSQSGTATVRLENTNTNLIVGSVIGSLEFEGNDLGASGVTAAVRAEADSVTGKAALVFDTGTAGAAAERMRIDSNGTVLVGKTADDYSVVGPVMNGAGQVGATASSVSPFFANRLGTDGAVFEFYKTQVNVGTISVTGSATAYNTSSDYRLKENITPVQGAGDIVKAMQPVTYTFKSDGSWHDGFLAHELQELHPRAVTGAKDAMKDEEYEVTPAVLDEDGNVVTEAVMGTRSVPDYQGVDYSKLTPILTAALQEALNKIDALEARLTALEAV